MEINEIAVFHSPLEGKFGLPRQAGLAPSLKGRIEFVKEWKSADALRGLEDFEYVWLIWGFSLNKETAAGATVRPPRLGGNERVGVFASRSPYRPNPLGLSCVKIENINPSEGWIDVSGADLADGTPIYDVKPYLAYSDAKPDAKGGFTDSAKWEKLEVEWPESLSSRLSSDDLEAVTELLAQDPRPRYQSDPERIYGLVYKNIDIRFKVSGCRLIVVELK